MNIVKELVKMARSVIAAKGTIWIGGHSMLLRFVPDTWDYNKWDAECVSRYNDFKNLFEAGWLAEFVESVQLEMGKLPAHIGAGMQIYLEIGIFIDSEKFRFKDRDRDISDKFWLVIKRMEKAGYGLSRG